MCDTLPIDRTKHSFNEFVRYLAVTLVGECSSEDSDIADTIKDVRKAYANNRISDNMCVAKLGLWLNKRFKDYLIANRFYNSLDPKDYFEILADLHDFVMRAVYYTPLLGGEPDSKLILAYPISKEKRHAFKPSAPLGLLEEAPSYKLSMLGRTTVISSDLVKDDSKSVIVTITLQRKGNAKKARDVIVDVSVTNDFEAY